MDVGSRQNVFLRRTTRTVRKNRRVARLRRRRRQYVRLGIVDLLLRNDTFDDDSKVVIVADTTTTTSHETTRTIDESLRIDRVILEENENDAIRSNLQFISG